LNIKEFLYLETKIMILNIFSDKNLFNLYFYLKNASNTHFNTHFSTHSLWLVKIHTGPTKFIWDLHDLVRPVWILTNQRECVEKCVAIIPFLFCMLDVIPTMLLIIYLKKYALQNPYCIWIKKTPLYISTIFIFDLSSYFH